MPPIVTHTSGWKANNELNFLGMCLKVPAGFTTSVLYMIQFIVTVSC